MKRFTKITLIIAGIMASLGTVCIIIACSMGLNWNILSDMVQDGKFSYQLGNGLHFGITNNTGSSSHMEPVEIRETCDNLDIEFGAGSLEICYADVEYILIEPDYVKHFSAYVEDNTLYIEGGLEVNSNSNAALTITLPNNKSLKTIDLEIGASEASASGLTADALIIEVGAGSAEFTELNVQTLDIEVGVGELTVEAVGKESDYSYSVECGIGTVSIGDNTYSGVGTSHDIEQPSATRFIDIECGIGEVEIEFTE